MALIFYLNNASSHLVWISIKEKEKLLSQTHNILIGNLCAANLISAVFIKSISVIYHGYAVATGQWDFRMAFCTVYTGKWKPEDLVFPKSLIFAFFCHWFSDNYQLFFSVTSRSTWAVFPYTIMALCWVTLLARAEKILAAWKDSRHVKVSIGHYFTILSC